MKQTLIALLRRLGDVLLDLLYPERAACLCCDRALGEDEQDGLCPACVRALERLELRQQEREAQGEMEPLPPEIAYVHAAYP